MIDNPLKRLNDASKRWVGTPYMAGQAVAGSGVDCVRLVDCVLQEALGLTLEPLPRFPADSAYHNKEVVTQMQRLLFERFDLEKVPDDETRYRMGDVLALSLKSKQGQVPGNAHHICIMVSPVKAIDAWPGTGVRILGIGGVLSSFHVLKHWRSEKMPC